MTNEITATQNVLFDGLDNAKEHAADLAAYEADSPATPGAAVAPAPKVKPFRYSATFADGSTNTRKSFRHYAAAWRVTFVRTGHYMPGSTGAEWGFSGTMDLARKAAAAYVASVTVAFTNPKWGKAGPAYQITLCEAVAVEMTNPNAAQ